MKPPTGPARSKPTRSARMGENIEAFTREAREERMRSQHAWHGGNGPSKGWQSKKQYMTAVEIPVQKSNKSTGETHSSTMDNKLHSTNGQSHNDTPRESPDELQGARTVPDVWRQAEARYSRSRSSPNDIRPTDFSPASSRRAQNGRQKADIRKKQQSRLIFSIRFIRFDDQTLDRPLELVLDEDSGHFFVKLRDHQLSRNFDFNRINSIIFSDDPGNKKMRLRYPGSQATTNYNVDIEFSNDKDYCSFKTIVSEPNHVRHNHKSK